MAKRKTDDELVHELGVFNHLESQRRLRELVAQQPQRQDSLVDQLKDLVVLANRAGMYDAADFITTALEKHT